MFSAERDQGAPVASFDGLNHLVMFAPGGRQILRIRKAIETDAMGPQGEIVDGADKVRVAGFGEQHAVEIDVGVESAP